jgi:hypothetical protein
MQHNSSAMPVGEETWEQRSMEYDEDLEAIVVEIAKPSRQQPIVGGEISTSFGELSFLDELATPQPSYGEIAASGYAPLAIREAEIPVAEGSLDLDLSSGGEIAPFHGEYLASSQELLRQIQSGSVDPSDSVGIPAHSTATEQPKRQYLTKLQFGGVVAAFMLAGAAIYACLNPSILAPLTATQVATVTPATTVSNVGQSIQSPNLAANEFTPLNLNAVGTLPAPSTLSSPNVDLGTDAAPNTPVAIPYNPTTSQVIPPTGNTIRVNLADSLVKSLLPPNFQSTIKPIGKNRGLGMKP